MNDPAVVSLAGSTALAPCALTTDQTAVEPQEGYAHPVTAGTYIHDVRVEQGAAGDEWHDQSLQSCLSSDTEYSGAVKAVMITIPPLLNLNPNRTMDKTGTETVSSSYRSRSVIAWLLWKRVSLPRTTGWRWARQQQVLTVLPLRHQL